MRVKKNIGNDIKVLIEKCNQSRYNSKDIQSWRLFYNKYNPLDYSYFTGIKSQNKAGQEMVLEYPAKFRWIPIQKKNLNVLISTQELRPFVKNIYVSDQKGVERKFHARARGMVEFLFGEFDKFNSNYTVKLEQLSQQQQQVQQMLQKEPESEEEAAQQQQLKIQMPFINSQINSLQTQIENKQLVSTDRMEKASRYFKYDAKDFIEEVAEKLFSKIKNETSFKEESNKSFRTRLVTGTPFYYVNHESGNKSITIKNLDSMAVTYPSISNIEWTQELPWVAFKERWSYSDIKRVYGHVLSADQLKELEGAKSSGHINPVFASTNPSEENPSGSGAILIQDEDFSYNGESEMESIDVLKIWYKKERKIQARVTPNRHNPARPHIHFVDDDNLAERPIRKDKGEILETRYVSDRYYGIVLNQNIYIGFEIDEIQPRNANNLSEVYLPIVGKTNTHITDQATSIIQDTKDLNELYQVLNYHRELYVAVSGVKGQIIDVSQRPSDMSLEEQRYHRKQGSMYIQTKTKSGRNIGSNYNQWKSYDDSISPAVGQLENMMNNIDETMGMMMGVPRQRVGQTVSTDQVGSNEQAVHMANLVTETLHYNQDGLDAKAIELGINIHINNLLKPGEILSVPTDDLDGMDTFQVPMFDFKNSQIGILVKNNNTQLEMKRKLEMLASSGYQRGELPFSAMMKVYTTESIKELEKKLEYFNDQAKKQAAEANAGAMQAEAEKERLSREVEMTLKQEDIKARMAELEFNKVKSESENIIKNKEIDSNTNIELMKLSTERQTEATYLQEQNRASTVDEELEYLRIKLDAMFREQELLIAKRDSDVKKGAAIGSSKSDSGRQASKEKVKDK